MKATVDNIIDPAIRQPRLNPFIGLRACDVLDTVRQVGAQAVRQPTLLLEQKAALARELMATLSGNGAAEPQKGDKRFADPAWQSNPFYRIAMQSYLTWCNALNGYVERSVLDDRSKERAQFLLQLITDALAPTNTLLGNPAALRKIVESGGTSLISGLKNAVTDLLKNQGMPSQVDMSAFEVGRNLGTTPRRRGLPQ